MQTQVRALSTLCFAAITVFPLATLGAAEPVPLAMGDLSEGGYAGARLSHRKVDFESSRLALSTFEVFGEARAGSAIKLFGAVPVAHAMRDDDSLWTLGNLTGGIRLLRGTSTSRQGLSLSLSLPTARDEGDDALAAYLAGVTNTPKDAGRYLPSTTTLRAAGSVRRVLGQAFAQAEAGIDQFFTHRELESEGRTTTDDRFATLGRFTVGAGSKVAEDLSLLGELVTVSWLDLPRGDGPDGTLYHTLEAGVEYDHDGLGVLARVSFPLDEEIRQRLSPGLTIEALGRF
jgi:hypothetical protein